MALGDIPVSGFRPYQNWGGENWEADWDGESSLIKALGVMKSAIQSTMEVGVDLARADHPDYPPASEPGGRFANRTGQLAGDEPQAIDIIDDAQIDWGPEPVHVWGRWGVHDWPAFRDLDVIEGGVVMGAERGPMQDVTIENRAMFLEFGTARMYARPFLYPAWDESKAMLPVFVMGNRALMSGAVPFRG